MAAFASILESEAAAVASLAEPTPAVPEPAPIVPVSTPAKPGFKTGGFKTTFQPSAFDAVLPDAEEDVDGAAMEEDVDGDAVDVDGEEVDVDVDGEAVDVDGEDVLQEDLDGEPAPAAVEEKKTETVVIRDDGDAVMDMTQSDDDIF